MSVTGAMYNINATTKLSEQELKQGVQGDTSMSWHHQFKHSSYIFVSGLNQKMTEGDVIVVFSQFGEVIDVNMVRDKDSGASKGFAFLAYENQKSTILAVDNMNGYQLVGRYLRVDHVMDYKAPKEYDEDELDSDGDPVRKEYKATGPEGKGMGIYNQTDSQKRIASTQDGRARDLAKMQGEIKDADDDEAWAKSFEAAMKAQEEEDELAGLLAKYSVGKKDKKEKKQKADNKKDKKTKSESKQARSSSSHDRHPPKAIAALKDAPQSSTRDIGSASRAIDGGRGSDWRASRRSRSRDRRRSRSRRDSRRRERERRNSRGRTRR
mmetsp:Transcript_23252/g.51163  ORF Transcript_23252/g.51163 Transcript_23252/m.51163 type:complete len:324 (+) Transcript_23252:70-1041(+)